MRSRQKRAYGSWPSPITPELMLSSSVGLGELNFFDGSLYWIEMRPEEKGRYAIVKRNNDGYCSEVLASEYNARTRVHEYGGGSYLPTSEGLVFANFNDQALYLKSEQQACQQLTHNSSARYADMIHDHLRERVICVRENHQQSSREAKNSIVAVSTQTGDEIELVEGADFYSNPRLSPDGKQLCWIAWEHPNMPWDNTALYLADVVDNGKLENIRRITEAYDESVCQPGWSPSNRLYFISDRTGWWNIYRLLDNKIEQVVEMQAEFATPQWSFRECNYDFVDDDSLLCIYWQEGVAQLASVDINSGQTHAINLPFTDMENVCCDGDRAWLLAASPESFPAIIELNIVSHDYHVIRKSNDLSFDNAFISKGQSISFSVDDATNEFSHAFYYPPENRDFIGLDDELPPLIVMSHGGPTGASHNGLKMVVQFFTSRGFAVVDVNYGGSTGYGRAYRERLKSNWGIVDVRDCSQAALWLAEQQKVDKQRLAIRGGSAGGFTTLAALAFTDVFKAGASHYGVSHLEALATETHKFESRYLDSLIGPYPEAKSIYDERSPINAVDRLSCPVIFFQGLEDKIVLPNQAEMMVNALKQKNIPVVYIAYEGEQHGFRQSKNIKRTLEAELYFYSSIFNFDCADEIEPVTFL